MEKYIFFTEKNFNKLKAEIEKARKKHPELKIGFIGQQDEINRQVLEKAKIDLILLNLSWKKDFSKQRDSGMNIVLANIAKKNNIAVGINLEELLSEEKKERAKILARIMQNIQICRKKKVQMKFISEGNTKNSLLLKSFGAVIGMPTWMVKNL